MSNPFAWRIIFLLGALAALAGPARAQLVSLDVLKGSGYGVVPIDRPMPNILSVKARVNGHEVRLIVDTGCESVSLRRSLLPSLGLKTTAHPKKIFGVSGKSEDSARMGTADSVQVGNVALTGVPITFTDLGVFNAVSQQTITGSFIRLPRLQEGDGFLGADYLSACSAVIDLQNLRLYLRAPGTGRRTDLGPGLRGVGMTEIPFSNPHRNRYYVKAEVNGVSGQMMLDTGDYLTILAAGAPGLKLEGFSSRLQTIDVTGAASRVSRVALRSFRVGDFLVPTNEPVLLQSLSLGTESRLLGLLGMDVIGRNAGIIDCGQRKLYLIRPR